MQGQAPVWNPWVSLKINGMKKGALPNKHMGKYLKHRPKHVKKALGNDSWKKKQAFGIKVFLRR